MKDRNEDSHCREAKDSASVLKAFICIVANAVKTILGEEKAM
jgi:hypothetical protein